MWCPPDGRHLGEAEEEAEVCDGGWVCEVLPEGFAEEKGEAAGVTHAEARCGLKDGVRAWCDGYAAALQDAKGDCDDGLWCGEDAVFGDDFDLIR